LLDRLTTPPIELPQSLIVSANVIVFLLSTRYQNRQIRRVGEVLETVGLDEEKGKPVINRIFKWNPINDTFDILNKSVMLKQISEASGMSEEDVSEELKRRMLVLEWMRLRNIVNYRDVNSIINMYYAFPDRIIRAIYSSVGG
jgi:flagellar protein FlaI